MKNLFTLLFTLFSLSIFAQNANFDGTWVGYIYDDDDELVNYLLLVIEDGEATQYGYNSETEEYYVYTSNQKQFVIERNNAIFLWMNQGGAWSETQSYHISLVNENKAEVIWTRQVNNVKEEDNDVWDMRGSGTMEKLNLSSYAYPYVEAQSFDYIVISEISISESGTSIEFVFTNNGEDNIIGTFHGPDSDNAMYITDQNRVNKYKVTDISGAEFGVSFSVSPGDSKSIVLSFESIGDLKAFDLLEPGEPGTTWNFYGINLK